MPPDFCASAGPAIALRSAPRQWPPEFETSCSFLYLSFSSGRLFVEPDVFHAPAVVDAVDHQGQSLDIRLPAGRAAAVKDDRPGDIFRQLALNLPQHFFAPRGVALARLPLDQLIDFGVAVAVPIKARTAAIEVVEDRVWVGTAGLQVEADGEVLAQDLREILGRFDQLELAVDIDVLDLVDQQHSRISEALNVARADFDGEPVVGAVTRLLHDPAALLAVLRDVE